MKVSIYKARIELLLTVLLFMSSLAATARSEYTKTFTKTYPLSANGKVNLENMHGSVKVMTWDRDEVHMVVTVKVNANNQGSADDVFERITIDFSGDPHYVSAKTNIDNKKSSWWFIKSWWDDDDVEIDYEVSMPATVRLELSHKYGNADLEDFTNDISVNLKYGDLKIDQVGGNLQLDCAYGNASIARLNNATIEIGYFKLRINDANKINIESKYSQIYVEAAKEIISTSGYDGYHLGDVGNMTNEGKYDNIEIDKIESLKVNTKYTKVSMEHLMRSFTGNMSYGGLEIAHLDRGFEKIDVQSRYTGLEIDTDEIPSFRLDVEGKYLSYKEPDNFSATRDQRENNQITVVGHRGAKDAKSLIRVRAEYGGLKIK